MAIGGVLVVTIISKKIGYSAVRSSLRRTWDKWGVRISQMSVQQPENFADGRAIIGLRAFFTAIIAFLIVACTLSTAAAVDRGRVKVMNGTVVSDRNTILRGARIQLLKAGIVPADSYWHYLNATLGLNAVRYGVKTDELGRPIAEQLPALDLAVNRAAANNLYLMISNSTKSGTYDLAELRAFWSVVAPRYKNRSHVFYEMTNEPVKGGPHWGAPEQFTDKVLADLKSIYILMRTGAPKTHIVMFTTANIWPNCASWAALIKKMKKIDWSKASVGYHHYNGTHQIGEAGLQCLRGQYPLLMTETNYWTIPDRAILRDALSINEKLRISWFSLDGSGSAHRLENEIIPALNRDGYAWPAEN